MKSEISVILFIAAVSATDYCAPNLCSKGQKHIGCKNNGQFAKECPAGKTKMVKITTLLKAKILDSHNGKRNTIAGGKLPGFKSAVRMATMFWDNELAMLASYNVKRCKFEHDECRNTNAFKYSGQNLAKFWWKGASYTDEQLILPRIEDWWNEYKDTKQSDIDKYPTSSNKQIGHFTVMTSEKNIAVGCAAIRFPENGFDTLTFACNYARTNILGQPLHRTGPTASKCTTGKNKKYPALCSEKEQYKVNEIP